MRYLIAAVFALTLSTTANAQSWSFNTGPTGKSASATVPSGRMAGLILSCTRADWDPAAWSRATGESSGIVSTKPGQIAIDILDLRSNRPCNAPFRVRPGSH